MNTMEVIDICDINNTIMQSLNQTTLHSKLNLLVISPILKIRSSYSRVAKYSLDILKQCSALHVDNYEISQNNLENVPQSLKNYDIVFFIIPPYFITNILDLCKNIPRKFETWFYFKPIMNAVNNILIDWLNREASVIFVPTESLKIGLKQRINRPVELLDFSVSGALFYPINKYSARKMMQIPSEKRLWLAPAENTKISRIDILIQAYVEYLGKLPDATNELLLCLGNFQNLSGFQLQDIYNIELQEQGYDLEKYAKNFLVLDSQAHLNGLSEHIINCFYNAADAVIFTNSYSNHSFTPIEILATNKKTLFLPRHSWFIDAFKNANNCDIIWCNPILKLYRASNEDVGTEFMIHPSELAQKMKEYVDSAAGASNVVDSQEDQNMTNASSLTVEPEDDKGYKKIFNKYIQIASLSRE